jgi:hypothetical protein
MKFVGIFLVIFGILIISYPEFLSYLIWGFFLFIWLNIVLFNLGINSMKKKWETDGRWSFFKFWKYKIYK